MKPIIPVMRAALEQIQELHKPVPGSFMRPWVSCSGCYPGAYFPCPTRKLADEGLGGEERNDLPMP